MAHADLTAPLRVLVADGHDLFRRGLRGLLDLEPDLEVVADVRRGDEAVQRAAELRPDVVVMDVNTRGISGIEATRQILERSPDSAILMLTASRDEQNVLDAILAGASGYLLKDATLPEIIRGIHCVAAGDSVIAPSVAPYLLTRLRRHGRVTLPPVCSQLSPRELEVLRLIVDGCENSEIGACLHLSPSTIKRHVSNTLDKLGVNNRIQAAVLAVRTGLVAEHDARSG